MLAMPWIATGVFVYQSFITESKEWGSFVIAQSSNIISLDPRLEADIDIAIFKKCDTLL